VIMKLKVHIDDITREQWENHARLFADYNIYQTWPYQQVRAEMDGQTISRAMITDETGNPVMMCQVRIKNVSALRLKIGYIQWGPLLRRKDGVECPAEAIKVLREAYLGPRVNILRLVPNIQNGQTSERVVQSLVSGGFNHVGHYKPYRTFILNVDESQEQIRAGLHKSFRRDLKTAEKSGLRIQQGTGEEFCTVLDNLYGKLLDRKGFKGLNPDEFIKAQSLLSNHEKMNFILASQDNEPAAILLSAPFGETSLVLLAAASETGLECGASYVVWYQGAIAANQAGMKYYDLGGIDQENNPKVYQFKSRIGGSEIFYIGAFEAASGLLAGSVWSLVERIYRGIRK
jgi:lipid II:glycine glycyltransferase (peptidoglycan interpeptide bridge formation enzyme)